MLTVAVADGVAQITLNHPPANAMSPAWCDEFHRVLDEIENRRDWSILHIRSELRVFSGGADLKVIGGVLKGRDAAQELANAARTYQRLFARIEQLPRVTLAEIGGAAVGGGLELALACDLRIADEKAKVGLPEAALGLIPGAGGTQRLTTLCGRGVASRLILGGEIVSGTVARDLGVVQWAVSGEELAGAVNNITRRIGSYPIEALREIKLCLSAAESRNVGGYELELKATGRLATSERSRAAIERFLQSQEQKRSARISKGVN